MSANKERTGTPRRLLIMPAHNEAGNIERVIKEQVPGVTEVEAV